MKVKLKQQVVALTTTPCSVNIAHWPQPILFIGGLIGGQLKENIQRWLLVGGELYRQKLQPQKLWLIIIQKMLALTIGPRLLSLKTTTKDISEIFTISERF